MNEQDEVARRIQAFVAAKSGVAPPRPSGMAVSTWPLRLALLRALLVAAALAVPSILVAAAAGQGLQRGHVFVLAYAVHAGLGVLAAARIEGWAGGRGWPARGALLAGGAAWALAALGYVQGTYATASLLEGTEAAFAALDEALRAGAPLAVAGVGCTLWAMAVAAITHEQLKGERKSAVPAVVALTFLTTLVPILMLTVAYGAADALDRRLGRRAAQ